MPKAIIAVSKAVSDLYTAVLKRRRISHFGRATHTDVESDEHRARSLEAEIKQDKLDTLSLNQWSKETASKSKLGSKEMNEKHKAFVYSLGQKGFQNPEVKHLSLEQQQNQFFSNLSSLAKTLNGPSSNASEVKNKDFWVRKNGHVSKFLTKETAIKEKDQREDSEQEQSKKPHPVELANEIASTVFNKNIVLGITLEKIKKRTKKVLAEKGKLVLDQNDRKEVATKTFDTVLNKMGGHFDNLKRSGVLNSLKGSYTDTIGYLVQTTQKLDELESMPALKEQSHHEEVSVVYLKYLRKRRRR